MEGGANFILLRNMASDLESNLLSTREKKKKKKRKANYFNQDIHWKQISKRGGLTVVYDILASSIKAKS